MKSLSDKTGFLILANLVKYSVGFIMPMALVRMLSQTDYGTYQQLNLVSGTAIGIMTLGVPTSVYYFYHQVSGARRGTLIAQTTLLVTLGGLAAGAAVALWSPALAAQLGNPSMAGLLAITAISTAFTIASEHAMPFMISQDRLHLAVMFEIVESVSRVALLLAPLLLGYGLLGVTVCVVVFSVVRWAGRSGYLFLTSNTELRGWSRSTFIREQLDYSVPLSMVSVSALIGGTFNKGIIAASYSPAQYAVYAVGNFPIPLASIFQASVADVLRASLPPLVRDGNYPEIARVLREATRKLSVCVLPSFVFLFGFAPELITLLFTDTYRESVAIFRIFLLNVPLDMLILSAIPHAFGRTRLNFYINVATMVVLVALSYVLLKTTGIYGAATAVVASRYFSTLLFVVVALKLTRTTIWQFLPWRHMGATLLCSGVALLAARPAMGLTGSRLINASLAGAVYSLSFLGLAVAVGVLTAEDRALIRRWVTKLLGKRPRLHPAD